MRYERHTIIEIFSMLGLLGMTIFGVACFLIEIPMEAVLAFLALCFLVIGIGFFHDPLTMPMKLKPKVKPPSKLDQYLLRLSWIRKPWTMSPAASEIAISHAVAEPRLADTIEAALVLALRHKHKRTQRGWSDFLDALKQLPSKRGPNELVALDWIVPGKPIDVYWCIDGKRLDVCAKWDNGLKVGSEGVTIPNHLIPNSVRTSLAGRRFGDLFDLPFVRPDRVIQQEEIRLAVDSVILDIFGETRNFDDVRDSLNLVTKTRGIPGLTVSKR